MPYLKSKKENKNVKNGDTTTLHFTLLPHAYNIISRD